MLSGILISKLDITPEHYDLRHLNWDFYYGLECVSHKCICRKKTDYVFNICNPSGSTYMFRAHISWISSARTKIGMKEIYDAR